MVQAFNAASNGTSASSTSSRSPRVDMQGTSGDGVGSLQVCQAIVPNLDRMTAKLVLTARRTVFCSKGIADHDAVIPSLCRKEIVKCCKVGVASIADHLAVDISDTKGSTHKAWLGDDGMGSCR